MNEPAPPCPPKWWGQDDEPCHVRAYLERQKDLPPERRSRSIMIACPCRRCRRHTL